MILIGISKTKVSIKTNISTHDDRSYRLSKNHTASSLLCIVQGPKAQVRDNEFSPQIGIVRWVEMCFAEM